MEVSMNAMTARINYELGATARHERRNAVAWLALMVGAIVLGHNTLVTLHPIVIHIPLVNLVCGLGLIFLGVKLQS